MFGKRRTDDEKFGIIEQLLGELYTEIKQLDEWQRKASQKNINQRFVLSEKAEKIAIKIEKKMRSFRHGQVIREKKEEEELLKLIKKIVISLKLQRKKYKISRDEKILKRIEVVGRFIQDLFQKFKHLISEAEYAYHLEFGSQLKKLLNKYKRVKQVVEEYSEKFIEKGSNPNLQKRFVQELIKSISKIPFDSWSFTFRRSLESGRLNCSGCATLLAIIIEHTQSLSRIPLVEIATPYDHAMNIVHFSDGTMYYSDPRQNKFFDLAGKILRTWNIRKVRFYRLNDHVEHLTGFKVLPVLSAREGILLSYSNNIGAMFSLVQKYVDVNLDNTNLSEYEKQDLEDAHEVINKHGFSERDIIRTRYFVLDSDKAFNKYRNSRDYKVESSRLEKEKNMKQGLEPILAFTQKYPQMINVIANHLPMIQAFLEFRTNTLVLGSNKKEKELAFLFMKFRKPKQAIYDINKTEYILKVREMCDSIRKMSRKAA